MNSGTRNKDTELKRGTACTAVPLFCPYKKGSLF